MGNYEEFQEICADCVVSPSAIRAIYTGNPESPWKTQQGEYGPLERSMDAEAMFGEIFDEEGRLSLADVAARINTHVDTLSFNNACSGTLCTAGNIRVAVARAAANALRGDPEGDREDDSGEYGFVDTEEEVEVVTLDIEKIRRQGKPSPYGELKYIRPVGQNRDGSKKGTIIPADYVAARKIYGDDMAALLIAREYEMEELMPVPVEQK